MRGHNERGLPAKVVYKGTMSAGPEIARMVRCTRPDRRALLSAALSAAFCLPGRAQVHPALPSFTQNGRHFVFLAPFRIAPNATLPGTDGKPIPLLEPGARRPGILYFGATWCPPCRSELQQIESRLGGPGPHPRVVPIMVDAGGLAVVGPFLQRAGLKRPLALDPRQSVAKTASASAPGDPFVLWALPVSYILAPDGRIIGYLPGAIDWTRPEVAALLRQIAQMG